MGIIRQSTAATVLLGPVLDSSGAEYTSMVIGDLNITKNGSTAAMAAAATLTHSHNGYYLLAMTTGNTDTVGLIAISSNKSTYSMGVHRFNVVEEAVYDSLFAASGAGYQVPIWAAAGSTVNLSATTIKTATDVETDTADIQSRLPAALVSGRIDASVGAMATGVITASSIAADAGVEVAAAVWDRVLTGATHNITNSAGRRLRQLDAVSILDGTAAAGASNSITLDGSASATDDIYDENMIVITEGTGAGQTRVIVEYNGTTKVAIVNRAWQTTPSTDSVYEILAGAQADIAQHGLAQGGTASTITLSSAASATDDIYVGSHVYISTSTGTGQTRLVTDYNGTTKVATISPDWVTSPTSASVYKVIPIGRSIVDSGTVTTVTGTVDANLLTVRSSTVTAKAGRNLSYFFDNSNVDTTSEVANVGAIKAKTDNLPTDPADASDIAASFVTVNTKLDTIDDLLDTEVAAIKVATDRFLTMIVIDGAVYQYTANALELAPGGGGGGDATLANQEEIIALLEGVEVVHVSSPVIDEETIEMVQGDTYDGIAQAKLTWTVAKDYTDGWAGTFTIRDADDAVVTTATATIVNATTITVTVTAPTGLTMTGCPGVWQGKFDVQMSKTTYRDTIARGSVYVYEDQTRT